MIERKDVKVFGEDHDCIDPLEMLAYDIREVGAEQVDDARFVRGFTIPPEYLQAMLIVNTGKPAYGNK